MWLGGIIWLWIVGVLIAVLLIGLRGGKRWFTSWREGAKAALSAGPSRGPRRLKPHTPEDCPACRGERSNNGTGEIGPAAADGWVTPYAQVKSARGRKKRLTTAGYACPNPRCAYFGVTDEAVHALVHCGSHGKHERIPDLKCQACGRKVSVRYGTALYRLKTASARIAMVLTALAEGVGVAVATRIFGHSEFTIQTGRAPEHGR